MLDAYHVWVCLEPVNSTSVAQLWYCLIMLLGKLFSGFVWKVFVDISMSSRPMYKETHIVHGKYNVLSNQKSIDDQKTTDLCLESRLLV